MNGRKSQLGIPCLQRTAAFCSLKEHDYKDTDEGPWFFNQFRFSNDSIHSVNLDTPPPPTAPSPFPMFCINLFAFLRWWKSLTLKNYKFISKYKQLFPIPPSHTTYMQTFALYELRTLSGRLGKHYLRFQHLLWLLGSIILPQSNLSTNVMEIVLLNFVTLRQKSMQRISPLHILRLSIDRTHMLRFNEI